MVTRKISARQRSVLLSKFDADVDWDTLDSVMVQKIIDSPGYLGKQFTTFINNGCRLNLRDMKVVTAPFDPMLINKGWKIIPEEQDQMSNALTEVDFSNADFVTCIADGETKITGEEKLRRLSVGKQTRYGATVFMALLQDYQSHNGDSILETLYQTKGLTYMDFFGDVLLSPKSNRNVLGFYQRSNGRWYWDTYYVGCCNWGVKKWSVVSQVGA